MANRNVQHLERFEEALETWTDERFCTRRQFRAAAMFLLYLVNLSETDGWRYDGHSIKVGHPMCVLVVKATMEEVPVVVFTSARSTMGCVVTFMRKLEEDLLEWAPDKYRQ